MPYLLHFRIHLKGQAKKGGGVEFASIRTVHLTNSNGNCVFSEVKVFGTIMSDSKHALKSRVPAPFEETQL